MPPLPPIESLRIISKPSVTHISGTSVAISWQTNRAADSTVRYDSRWGKYGHIEADQKQVTDHSIQLTGLQTATTYHLVVESADAEGDTVKSRDQVFTTATQKDNQKPSITLSIPDTLSGVAEMHVDADDDTEVEKVIFYLDGEPAYTDYSAPFEWECDTGGLDEGSHHFGARGFDSAGNIDEIARDGEVRNHFAEELSPVEVEILTPESGDEVYGHVLVSMQVTHELDSRICYLELRLDGDVIWEENYDREFGFCLAPPIFETCVCDFSTFESGSSHVIEVGARDVHDNWGWASRRVSVLEPEVNIYRNLQRNGNYFYVVLTVENTGEIDIDHVEINDTNSGFQCIKTAKIRERAGGGDWNLVGDHDCEVDTARSGHSCTISSGDLGTLRPDEAIRLEYSAVPVLYHSSGAPVYAIGETLEVSYEADGREYLAAPTCTRWASSEYIDRAIWESDYLIVTKPSALFDSYVDADVNDLLSTMAELARDKWGVLGYLPSWAWSSTFRGLILQSPEGDWHRELGGIDYMLIVGQDNIVSAFDIGCPGFFMDNTHGYINLSDYPYANIGGDERPEIKVGRIIGETAAELAIPIRTSLAVHRGMPGYTYNGSDVLLVSGPEDTWEASVKNVEGGAVTLGDMGIGVSIVHTDYYTTRHTVLAEALRIKGADDEGASFGADLTVYNTLELAAWLLYSEGLLASGTDSTFTDSEGRVRRIPPAFGIDDIETALERAETIQAERDNRGGDYGWSYVYRISRNEILSLRAFEVKRLTPDKDVMVFLGHGGPGSWGSVLDGWTASFCPLEPIDFGSCCPVVMGWSCLTGNYNDDSGRSIARSFLRNGAAAYIGSTEVSSTGANEQTTNELFWRGWTADSRIGDALFNLQTTAMELGWRNFVYEYNLYGDPKFGGS